MNVRALTLIENKTTNIRVDSSLLSSLEQFLDFT